MRQIMMIAVGLVFAISGMAWAVDDAAPRVRLYRGGEKELSVEGQAKLAAWSVDFLKTANFNTVNQPTILRQTVADIQSHYRTTVKEDYLVITYGSAVTVKTVGGEVNVVEIVIGLNRKDEFPSALFTVDSTGRIVAHEKYGAVLPKEIQREAVAEPAR